MLQAAKRLIAQRGVQPPEGITPGTAEYDAWAQQWLQAAIDAGDPAAIEAAGGGTSTEGGGGVKAPWQNATPSSEWLGKRNPTPSELRRFARESGYSEDFERFDDRQLAAWIGSNWNTQGGYFTNDFGDRVEKPTESGPKSSAAGFPTGEKSSGGGGGGGGGVGGGKDGKLGGWAAANSVDPDLQARLLSLFEQGGGYFDPKQRAGISLQGGGMVWRDPLTEGASNVTQGSGGGGGGAGGPLTGGTPMEKTIPGAGTTPPGPVPTPPGGTPESQSNPALVSAMLNAFSPQAPSKQGGWVSTPRAPAPVTPPASGTTTMSPGWPSPSKPANTFPFATSTPATTGTSPLMGALSQQYAKNNQWWSGGNRNYIY